MTGAEQVIELRSLRARVQGRVTASRTLMRRVSADNRDLIHRAQAKQTLARLQCGRILGRWLAIHGLGPTDPQRCADACRLILDAARLVFDGCASISVTTVDQLGGDASPYRTACGTGVARAVDTLQYDLREGPCIDAVELDTVTFVTADDLASLDSMRSWPRLCRAVETSGVRSSLSIAVPWSPLRHGLQAEHRAVGSVNLYAPEAHAFGRPETRAMFFGCWAGSIMSGTNPAELLDHRS